MLRVDRVWLQLLVATLAGCAGVRDVDRTQRLRGRTLAQDELQGRDLRGADLTGVELWGMRLAGADLRGASLRGAAFHNVDFTGAVLRHADLTDAAFDGWAKPFVGEAPIGSSDKLVLDRADLRGAQVRHVKRFEVSSAEGARLSGLDLSQLSLNGAAFAGVDLTGATLHGASCVRCDLAGAKLDGADLSGAALAYARLVEATLGGSELRGADLRMADLRGTDLRSARLAGAKLAHAGYDATTRLPADFDAAAHGMQKLNAGAPLCPPEGVRIVATYDSPPCAPVTSLLVAGDLLLLGGEECVATADRRDPRKLRWLHHQETLDRVVSLVIEGHTLIAGSGTRFTHKASEFTSGGVDVFDLDFKDDRLQPWMRLDLEQPARLLGAHGATLALATAEAVLLANLADAEATPESLREIGRHSGGVQLVASGDGHSFYVPDQHWYEDLEAPLVHLDLTGAEPRLSLLAFDALAPAAGPIDEHTVFANLERRAVPLDLRDPSAPKRWPEMPWEGSSGAWLAGRIYTGGAGLQSFDPASGEWNTEAGYESDLCGILGQALEACSLEPDPWANLEWRVGTLATDDHYLYLWAHVEREYDSGKLFVLEPCGD